MDSFIKHTAEVPKIFIGKQIFGTCFVMFFIINLMICFVRWGCEEQGKASADEKIEDENCSTTLIFRDIYGKIISTLLFLTYVIIFIPFFWNLGRHLKSASSLVTYVTPAILYTFGIYLLTTILDFFISLKKTDSTSLLTDSNPIAYCPSEGTVGTGSGDVQCTRNVFLSISDSFIQSLRTLNLTTFSVLVPLSNASTDVTLFGAIVLIPLLLMTATSAYIDFNKK